MSLVLVADDEPAVLEVLTEVVEDLGHDVVRAHDGKEALQLARTQRPHLVVTDHMMPRLSGLELCRALREEAGLREVPVILLSAALPPEATEAFAYLAKPFELDEFEALVKRTLEKSAVPAAPVDIPEPPPRAESSLVPADALFRWVAQSLKSPLSAAKMSLKRLERRAAKDGIAPDRLPFDAVTRQLERMEAIVGAMTDAAALSEGRLALNKERVELRALVEREVGRFRAAHADYRIELVLPGSSVELDLDERRYAQILRNLLANVVAHASPPQRARVEVEANSGVATLRVTDFGPGIAPSAQRTLFQGLQREDPPGVRRPGLGLFIASRLAALHGGTVTVQSASRQGATFTVAVPLPARSA
ncbi:MAG: response regulator [Myxococcaceae bacterium]|nr:response regulator [Myxococcaceae bacterium]